MFQDKPCICVPITSNANKHQSEVAIVGLHLSFDNGEERYINFTHPDEIEKIIDIPIIRVYYGMYKKSELNEIYKKCFVNLRLTNHDGCPNTNLEMV